MVSFTDDDDDWLNPDAQGGVSDPLVEREYNRIANTYSDAGYREGITDGKLATLQDGFDEGFALSVPLSRQVGSLRGRAAALLAISSASTSTSHAASSLVDAVRDLVRDLGALRRDQILPEDEERLQHEKEEHEEDGFELDHNEKREMEGLERSLELMGGGGDVVSAKRPGEEVLLELEMRLRELEGKVSRL
ncbi:hypothetical protein IAT38_005509 [Cryptococcus sp. DSM 104549]